MIITTNDYFKLHGDPEPNEYIANAVQLLDRVNDLLDQAGLAGIHPGIDQVSHNAVASGYRPPSVNAATSNAGAHSKHLTCQAVDIQDTPSRALAQWCCRNLGELEFSKLWIEDPRWTGGHANLDPWVHFQSVPPGSGKRIYIPSDAPPGDPSFFSRNGLPPP